MNNTEKIKTIRISPKIISKLNEAIKISLEFEELTGKQLNITSMVGEILVCNKLDLELVVKDTNACFDALDKENKRVQIKTRRYKGVKSALTGPLLNKQYEVDFDYAVLLLLNPDYTAKEYYKIESKEIQQHFDRINEGRVAAEKVKRKTMSVSQFWNLAKKNNVQL